MEQAAKGITSDAGGKLQPAQGLGASAEFGDKGAEVRVVDAPEAGVVESPPNMAKAIIDGDKRLLVKAKPVDIEAGDYTLLSVGKALGVVRLGEREEVDAVKFAELQPQHLVTDQLRAEWSEVQPSWSDGPWYVWPVEVVQKFDEPCATNVKPTPDPVVQGVVVEYAEVTKAIWRSPAGKTKIAKRIVSMLPAHTTYVEPFVGSGAVLFEKEPSKTEVINDADTDIAGAFKALKGITKEQVEQLKKKNWVGSKETYGALFKAKVKGVVDTLHRFLYLASFSFAGMRGAGNFDKSRAGSPTGLAARVEKLSPRLKNVTVMCGDYAEAIKKYDSKATAYFLDPPYSGYNAGVGEGKFDEDKFVDVLKAIKGKFLITYGTRGKLPKAAAEAGFKIKRIRPKRFFRAISGSGDTHLTQLVITNYEPVSKAEPNDGLEVEDVDLDSLQAEGTDQVEVFKQVAPDTNTEVLTKAELELAHWQLHGLFGELAADTAEGWSTEQVVNLHALVVEKMGEHPAPPDNGLDELSGDFEMGAGERPRWHEVPVAKQTDPDEDEPELAKASDPYLEAPPEDKPYRFTAQQHWRGKSMHADIRIALKRDQLMIGWTLNTQIKDAVKEPVTTLAEAKQWAKPGNVSKVSKINWATGEWASRKAGKGKTVRVEILSERKTPGPHSWLDVEGKTKDPEPGKAPPVGGTRQYPGVFDIVDQGMVEYGAQKPWFHEYYFQGGALNYRMFFRLLKVSKRIEPSTCEVCGAPEGVVDMGWGDADPAVCCTDCTAEYLTKANAVLPPSDERGTPEGNAWLAIYPEDQTPYVLGPEAVKKGWMPPDGRSALPAAIRSQVPAQFRYWGKAGSEARTMRDELAAAVKAGEVELNYEAPYKTTKASKAAADFVLQKQTADTGDASWWARLDVGERELLVLKVQDDPLETETAKAQVLHDRNKASMELQGPITAGHYLNPTKEIPSTIELLDSGKAEVLERTEELLKIQFNGEQLRRLVVAKRNESEWLWQSVEAEPTTKAVDFELTIPFHHVEVQKGKNGVEKRLVTGVVLEPDEVDAQNDWERVDTIERAAHNFLRNYNKPEDEGGTQLGYMHKQFDDIGIDLVESWIAPTDFQLGGKGEEKKVKRGSWLMTVHVHNDKKWREVKDGKLTGFSVGGTATVAGK
jgi:site-specific DNA-adenine methylase